MKYRITKKVAILSASVLSLGAIGGAAAMITNDSTSGADTSPIVTTLDNHEVRIKNAENNIKDLQTKTGTPPSTANDPIPIVTTQSTPTSSASSANAPVTDTPAPVVVTGYREIVLDADTSDCEYTYSDGTTYQFPWKTTNPQGSWQTDGSGANGHWVKTTTTNGHCDDKALGLIKT